MSGRRPRQPARPPARRQQHPRRWVFPAVVGVVTILLIGVVAAVLINLGNNPTPPLPQATGQPVDGITCDTSEQVAYHIHAHLAIYVNGQAQQVPLGIGIPNYQTQQTSSGPFVVSGSCFYWLHTHTADGIIHIESPTQRTYTLGQFFDIWGQPLSSTDVGPAHGTVIAYLNGQRYTADPRTIPLTAHALIQLDVGQDVPPQPFTFPPNL